MNSKVTYHQQVSYCGKPNCRKCSEGIGHGPYWYAYRTTGGQTTRTYIGKHLPPGAEAEMELPPMKKMDHTDGENAFDASGEATVSATPELQSISPQPANISLRISTLGQFRLERYVDEQWQTVTDLAWQQPETRALLGLLLGSPDRTVGRSLVLQALWPGVESAVTLPKLKRVVHDLRQVLGTAHTPPEGETAKLEVVDETYKPRRRVRKRPASSGPHVLRVDEDRLQLAEQEQVWVDADAFERLLLRLRTVGDSEDGLVHEQAIALYGGEYLPEERNAAWVVTRRQALRRSWSWLLLSLADLRLRHGMTGGAIDMLDRLLAADPVNEAAVQRLIVVLVRLKRRGEALRVYSRLVEVLKREYQAEPSEETRQVYEAVRRGEDIALPFEREASANEAGSTAATEREDEIEGYDDANGAEAEPASYTAPMQPTPIGRAHQSPLVGREHELDILQNLLVEVEQSARTQLVAQRRSTGIPLHTQRRPQTVFLMGEAGIGKTRLAEEVSRQAQQRGWSIMWSRTYAQESAIPYRLWTETLRRAITQSPWHRQEIGKHPSIYQPLTTLLPDLGSVLPRKQPLLTPEQEQLRLWEAARALLVSLSESTPLLIVLDDIQWADNSSCELLVHLARHVQDHPILLLCTCRDNEIIAHPLRDSISHMQREHTVVTVNVDPLTSEQIARLVSHLPEPMVQHIKDQAAGNPFFAEELARTTSQTVPKTVAAALDSRMSRLSTSCQQLLGNAAVLGGAFDLPVIYAMETGNALVDEDTVLDLLDEAQRAGVLAEEGTGTRITYHFWHPLLVSHLYERVSAARRLRLHQRAATILQRVYKKREEEVAATITHHLVRGGAEPLIIAHYAELAGDRAYTLSAYPEAERHYRLAVEQRTLEDEAPASEELLPGVEQRDPSTRLAYLLERLAECNMVLGHFPEARKFYERLLEMHSQQPLAQNEARRQEEAQVQALLWGEIGRTWRFSEIARARECFERGEAVLRAAGIVGGPAWARLRYQQSALYLQEGRYNEGHQAAQEALALFEQQRKAAEGAGEAEPMPTSRTTRIQRTLQGDPVDLGRTHAQLGALANGVGQRTQALAHLNTALALYEQYDYKREIAHVSCNIGYIHLKRGENVLAQVALRRALSLAERLGDIPLTSVVFSDLGELAAASGHFEEAENQYRRSLVLAERINDRQYMSQWSAALADVLRRQGRYRESATYIVRALSIGRAMRNAPSIGVALVALGRLRLAQASDPDRLPSTRTRLLARAHEDLTRALNLEGLEAETHTRAQLAFAQLQLLLGQVEQARATARKVVEEAHRHELALVEEEARKLL